MEAIEEILGICSCGDPRSMAKYVKDMFLNYVALLGTTEHSCWDKVDYEDLPTMFFLYWAHQKDFTEHGSTVRCSWMSKKGMLVLDILTTYLAEDV